METFSKYYLEEASQDTENIKKGLAGFINDVINANQGAPVSIVAGKTTIRNIVAAKPLNLSSIGGIPPYADLELINSNRSSTRISFRVKTKGLFRTKRFLKRQSIPALIKGIDSLEKIYPEVRKDFAANLLDFYVNTKNLTNGQVVRPAYGKLPRDILEKVLMGDKKLGGDCDYIMAIDKIRFSFGKKKIPIANVRNTSIGVVIDFSKDAILISKEEILRLNEVYIFFANNNNRTLYLGKDKVDKYNIPVVLGPKIQSNSARLKFGGKIVAAPNIKAAKNSDVFIIKPDKDRIFNIELKSGEELTRQSTLGRTIQGSQFPSDDSRSARNRMSSREDDMEDLLDVEKRDEIIETLIKKVVRGAQIYHGKRYSERDDEVELFTGDLQDEFEDEDTDDLMLLGQMSPDKLYREVIDRYYSGETPLTT